MSPTIMVEATTSTNVNPRDGGLRIADCGSEQLADPAPGKIGCRTPRFRPAGVEDAPECQSPIRNPQSAIRN
jgi:hypothetical protein